MKQNRNSSRFLIIILLYGLAVTAWNLSYNSVYHDEALSILMGHQVLSGQVCHSCAQYPGSVLIQPVLAAFGDSLGGLHGARAVGILFGLGLITIVYFTARMLLSEKHAIITALLFLFSSNVLYLSKLATYDIIAAFFLGLTFFLIILSEKTFVNFRKNISLLAGASTLFLAAVTEYVVSVFIPPLLLYVFWKHRFSRTLLFFLLPFSMLLSLYVYYAILPVREAVLGSMLSSYRESQVPFSILANWTLRWVAMPYLLVAFGMFHKEKGKSAIILFALSTPIIILHLLTGAEQSVNKNVIFSIIFLSPAAALGVDHMGSLFSMESSNRGVKSFLTGAILIVVWVYGFHDLRWLEKQYPDETQVINFLRESGHNNMTVAIDSDYGQAVFVYSLGSQFPKAQFVSFTEMQKTDKSGQPNNRKADFVIINGNYGKKYVQQEILEYLKNDYRLVKELRIPLSWGIQSVQIFGRR